ncbi:MAG: cadherin-like beta sandwich domain-containing protein [Muribaculaceae bacterium]|nr:cadherin-like beta sandwich domain-containing protein [Muribaculaceae bacterium]
MTTINNLRTLCATAAIVAASGIGCMADDASLNRLEIKSGGVNLLPDFKPTVTSYEIELGEDAASLATFSAAPASKTAVVDITINGTPYTNHTLGQLRGGENVIAYTVRDGGQSKIYTIPLRRPAVVREE